jgi:hypothetical protein
MDTQSKDDLQREVLTMATEDMYGLYEIVWTLNESHPDVPKEEKVALGREVIRGLLGRQLVELHRLEWNPPREVRVILPDELEAVLQDPSSWDPGQEYIGFVATSEGIRQYRTGLI